MGQKLVISISSIHRVLYKHWNIVLRVRVWTHKVVGQHFNAETSVQKPDSCRCFDTIQIGSINVFLPCPSWGNYPKVIQVLQQCVSQIQRVITWFLEHGWWVIHVLLPTQKRFMTLAPERKIAMHRSKVIEQPKPPCRTDPRNQNACKNRIRSVITSSRKPPSRNKSSKTTILRAAVYIDVTKLPAKLF